MKKNTENNRPARDYSPPFLEIIDVAVERGFANSAVGVAGSIDDWDHGGVEQIDVY
ncbi:hypothetical protein [Alistipes finegoldii]|uniref:hypothetical protein n=1 Tax=Alistipes finegoldii TaxID=214856 RepID=UPI0022DEE7BF|nr:hypothetical protein [Alistipes finegoldii]